MAENHWRFQIKGQGHIHAANELLKPVIQARQLNIDEPLIR
jgi:hypothetical protein